mgnify:CR=1 FL=1
MHDPDRSPDQRIGARQDRILIAETVSAGDAFSITVNGVTVTHSAVEGDTADSVRDAACGSKMALASPSSGFSGPTGSGSCTSNMARMDGHWANTAARA